MSRVSAKLTDSLYQEAKKILHDFDKNSVIAIKIQAIISAKKLGINKVSEVFGINKNSLHSWIKKFATYGIDGLKIATTSHKKTLLNQDHYNTILKWIKNEPNLTIKAIKIRIKNEFNIEISMTSVYFTVKKLNFLYITPRPRHVKQKSEDIEKFKKK
jgi:transposase